MAERERAAFERLFGEREHKPLYEIALDTLQEEYGSKDHTEAAALFITITGGQYLSYRLYKRWGAPRWAAHGIAALSAWAVLHNARLKSIQRQLREAS